MAKNSGPTMSGGYTPKQSGYGKVNNGKPKGTVVNKGNSFPKGKDNRHGSYTPKAGWSGVVGQK